MQFGNNVFYCYWSPILFITWRSKALLNNTFIQNVLILGVETKIMNQLLECQIFWIPANIFKIYSPIKPVCLLFYITHIAWQNEFPSHWCHDTNIIQLYTCVKNEVIAHLWTQRGKLGCNRSFHITTYRSFLIHKEWKWETPSPFKILTLWKVLQKFRLIYPKNVNLINKHFNTIPQFEWSVQQVSLFLTINPWKFCCLAHCFSSNGSILFLSY